MSQDVSDIAAMRHDGDLKDYLLSLTVGAPVPAKPKPAPESPAEPAYRITHTGGWPIGTAATGPTPTHGRCTCPLCAQADVIQMPRPHQHAEGEAA